MVLKLPVAAATVGLIVMMLVVSVLSVASFFAKATVSNKVSVGVSERPSEILNVLPKSAWT